MNDEICDDIHDEGIIKDANAILFDLDELSN